MSCGKPVGMLKTFVKRHLGTLYMMKCLQLGQDLKHVHLKQHPQQLYAISGLESSNIWKKGTSWDICYSTVTLFCGTTVWNNVTGTNNHRQMISADLHCSVSLAKMKFGNRNLLSPKCFNQINWGEGEVLFTHSCEGLLTQEFGSTEMFKVIDVQFHFGNHLPSPKQRGNIPFRRWFCWVQPGSCSTKKLTTHRLI